MSTAIEESLSTQFQRDGIVFPVPVLSPEETASYYASFSEVEDILGEPVKRMGAPALHFPWAYRLATEETVLDAVEQILGPDILISGSLVFCKYPHDPAFVAWHQDTFYSNLHLTPSVSAWIALLDSTPENGCMRVVPGSHARGVLPHQELNTPDNLLRRGEEILVRVEDSEAIDVTLRAGEMSLHHNSIIHGSRPNDSDYKRIGFIVRFVTPAYDLGPQTAPFLLARGNADCDHLQIAPPPQERSLHEMIASWKTAT